MWSRSYLNPRRTHRPRWTSDAGRTFGIATVLCIGAMMREVFILQDRAVLLQ